MSSSDSAYEVFGPYFTPPFDINTSTTVSYGQLSIIFDFTAPKEAKISARGIAGGGFMGHALWKIVASATITDKSENGTSMTTEINCSNFAATHTFDITAIEPQGKVVVHMNFKELVGFGVVPRPWDYYKSSSLTDVCLVVEGKRFYQNKAVLAYHSPFFRTLFFGEFAEKEKEEINMRDIYAYRFSDLMDAMHGVLFLNVSNFESLLEDADRFDIPIVVHRIEEYCLNNVYANISLHKKLFLSDKYGMPRLQAHVLSKWTKADLLVVASMSDPMFKELSKDTLLAVFAASKGFLK